MTLASFNHIRVKLDEARNLQPDNWSSVLSVAGTLGTVRAMIDSVISRLDAESRRPSFFEAVCHNCNRRFNDFEPYTHDRFDCPVHVFDCTQKENNQ